MKTEQNKTKQLVLTGMMTAVVCVLSILEIPMPTGVSDIPCRHLPWHCAVTFWGGKKGFWQRFFISFWERRGCRSFGGMTGGFRLCWGLILGEVLSGAFLCWPRCPVWDPGRSMPLRRCGFRSFRTGCSSSSGGAAVFRSFRKYVSDLPDAGVRSLSGERSSVGSGSVSGEPGA